MTKNEIIEITGIRASDIYMNEPMNLHTSFRIGGNADCFCVVRSIDILKKTIGYCKANDIPYFIIGLGSNLLVSDNGIRGMVIKLSGDFDEISDISETSIRCGAGMSLAGVCVYARNNGLGGIEFAWGIPGSVGGAVYMNAGAYGGEIKDVVQSVRYLDEDGNICEKSGKDLDFSYRHSAFSDTADVILDVTIELFRKNKNDIFYLMNDTMEKRKKKQPLNRPSAGSVFKRPETGYAAALIEECGLKGRTIGGAQVSEKHSGFIVNNGGATAKDVRELIEEVQKVVKEKTGVQLQCEVRFIGD